jgi:hypothetical protein
MLGSRFGASSATPAEQDVWPVVNTLGVLAFLDEEEQISVREEPDRPRRREGGPERKRQQFLIRRLIAVGLGVGFLILLVIGFRGCLEARSDRGLRNYASDLGTIMAESEQRGKDFFDAIEGSEPIDLQNQVASLRGASEALLDRAEDLDTPGQMRDAQSAATLSLRLRRDAMATISARTTEAAAHPETADAIESITTAMGSLYASDILWSQVSSPEITQVLDEEGVEDVDLPAGNFMPEGSGAQYLDQSEITELFSGVSGEDAAPGEHGLGLIQTTLGGTTLDPETTVSVPDDASEIAVQVQNQGTNPETDISVVVTVDGADLPEAPIRELGPGETGEAKVTISPLPQPGSEVTIEVLVAPVAGESVTDNNQSSYQVIFGTG